MHVHRVTIMHLVLACVPARPQVSRLDVDGFVELLQEVGGPLLAEHLRAWGAVTMPSEAASRQGEPGGQGGAARGWGGRVGLWGSRGRGRAGRG